ncbi:MAG TPA: hypothetical protein VFS10_15055 [Pyrinomonadaceae bacterium]|nr:hypothetical protein [Pyrinomonadaceae bacterium]
MRETKHFVNEGFGWTCKRCAEQNAPRPPDEELLPRFFREGEAEERETRLSTPSLARWKDNSRRTLLCPRCGVEEDLKSRQS